MVQILLKTLNGATRCFDLPTGSTVLDLKAKIADLEGIPLTEQRLISNNIHGNSWSEKHNFRLPNEDGSIFVTLSLSLIGGKGGFGSLLRGGPQGIFYATATCNHPHLSHSWSSAVICCVLTSCAGVRVKKITNYDACRDLETGRRLKYVNQVHRWSPSMLKSASQ